MAETQATIEQWRLQTFGPSPSVARMAARANEEMAELLRAIASDRTPEEIVQEAADVLIVLYGVAEMCGHDLHAAVDAKMAVNRSREWRLTDRGHGRHIGAET